MRFKIPAYQTLRLPPRCRFVSPSTYVENLPIELKQVVIQILVDYSTNLIENNTFSWVQDYAHALVFTNFEPYGVRPELACDDVTLEFLEFLGMISDSERSYATTTFNAISFIKSSAKYKRIRKERNDFYRSILERLRFSFLSINFPTED